MRKLISNFKFQISNSKAFTLVELLIFMGLFAILLLVLTNIFVSTVSVQLESQATSNVQQDGRYIIARLSYDINRATNITTPGTLGTQIGSLQLNIDGTTYTYTTNGNNQLTLQNIPITSFGTTISNLSFTRIGDASEVPGNRDSIQISFTLTSTTTSLGKGPEIKTFTSTVGMRGN